MTITPGELFTRVQGVVKEQEEYTQTLIYETLGLRWGEHNIPAGVATTITLNQPYADGVDDYEIWRQVRTSDDTDIDVVIIPNSKTHNTFQVWSSQAGTLSYMTTRPTINITP